MAEGNNEKRKFMTVNMDETMYLRIINTANTKGIHPSNYIIDLITIGLDQEDVSGLISKQDINVLLDNMRFKTRDINSLKHMAWEAIKNEDDELLETLRNIATQKNIDFDDVLNSINDLTVKPVLYNNPNGIDAAIVWLGENMQTGVEYKSSDMLATAQKHGFSKSVLNEAKRKINALSIRKSDGWYWIIE